jgi:SOS-response transcriptional repressor LexA
MANVLAPEALEEIARRLREARSRRYETGVGAARAMGVPDATYLQHESGTRGISRAAPRYARFFNVSLDWLMRGKGAMDGSQPAVQVKGRVGAGDSVSWADDQAEIDAGGWVSLPRESETLALVVQGDSMRPRFYPGEVILYERQASAPSQLLGQYAVVQLDDGRNLLKVIRPAPGDDRFRLESHNADPIESVRVQFAWKLVGVLRPNALQTLDVATIAKKRRRR